MWGRYPPMVLHVQPTPRLLQRLASISRTRVVTSFFFFWSSCKAWSFCRGTWPLYDTQRKCYCALVLWTVWDSHRVADLLTCYDQVAVWMLYPLKPLFFHTSFWFCVGCL